MGPSEQSPRTRLEFLDALRGLAAVLVVLAHASAFFPAMEAAQKKLDLGRVGVSAFFLVSGFVIPISISKLGGIEGVKTFAISRFFRLWPLYTFTLIFITLWTLMFPSLSGVDSGYKDHTFSLFFVNLTMLSRVLSSPVAIGAYWTLSYELVFYIFLRNSSFDKQKRHSDDLADLTGRTFTHHLSLPP